MVWPSHRDRSWPVCRSERPASAIAWETNSTGTAARTDSTPLAASGFAGVKLAAYRASTHCGP
jgi:hypothetical protein